MEKGSSFIRRKTKSDNFTILPNAMLQDDRLSWKARGLLSYMLSKPNDWVFYDSELVNHSKKDGMTSLRSAIKELKEFGYFKKEAIRDELGRVKQWVTYVDDEPIQNTENPQSGQPTFSENHNVDNQKLLSTDLLPSKNNNNKTYSPKFSTFDMKAAENLYNLILINNPNHKKPKLEKWANDVRLMRVKDKRTEEQIMYVINWSQNNKFWKSNILSIAKLREKFDQLVIKIKSEKENKVNENFNKPKQDAMSMMLEQLNLGGYENEPVNEPRRDQLLISEDGSTL